MLRVDINSPINPENGELLGDARLRAVVPTIKRLGNTRVVICAHQSRPGKKDFVSLENHAKRLSTILGDQVANQIFHITAHIPGFTDEKSLEIRFFARRISRAASRGSSGL